MVYIDENGAVLESADLSLGYLVDAEWVNHPEVAEVGHFEYEKLPGGGRKQNYVMDTPYQSARREVTVRRYVLYTEAELEAIAKGDFAARLDALEMQRPVLDELKENNDMLTACVLEMSELLYA